MDGYGISIGHRKEETVTGRRERESRVVENLDVYRPPMTLRSNKKINFPRQKMNLKGIEESPRYGICSHLVYNGQQLK